MYIVCVYYMRLGVSGVYVYGCGCRMYACWKKYLPVISIAGLLTCPSPRLAATSRSGSEPSGICGGRGVEVREGKGGGRGVEWG